ncbi:MAG: three-Cys-motif partner protein TcmP [bacterium]|nr:three-Cys-motif partner protein TcmP [bacterium]
MDNLQLFKPEPEKTGEILYKPLERPVWSENKAALIAQYLQYFVYITRNGTYIDAFAGPQTEASDQAWTVKKVLETEPKWFRHFYLFDKSPEQVKKLNTLADEHSDRQIQVHKGDSNQMLRSVLPVESIREGEATFCLLDQRTFQCEWQLCKHVSQIRPGSRKVEQFYFLATGWLSRALTATSTRGGEETIAAWFGNEDWKELISMSSIERAEVFKGKFQEELGYRHVKWWPIYSEESGKGRVMYHMIHATDHDDAPKQMYRAYRKTVNSSESIDQLRLQV